MNTVSAAHVKSMKFVFLPAFCHQPKHVLNTVSILILSALQTKTDTFRNSVYPDEIAHNGLSHLGGGG